MWHSFIHVFVEMPPLFVCLLICSGSNWIVDRHRGNESGDWKIWRSDLTCLGRLNVTSSHHLLLLLCFRGAACRCGSSASARAFLFGRASFSWWPWGTCGVRCCLSPGTLTSPSRRFPISSQRSLTSPSILRDSPLRQHHRPFFLWVSFFFFFFFFFLDMYIIYLKKKKIINIVETSLHLFRGLSLWAFIFDQNPC